jgi:hypothetical protein
MIVFKVEVGVDLEDLTQFPQGFQNDMAIFWGLNFAQQVVDAALKVLLAGGHFRKNAIAIQSVLAVELIADDNALWSVSAPPTPGYKTPAEGGQFRRRSPVCATSLRGVPGFQPLVGINIGRQYLPVNRAWGFTCSDSRWKMVWLSPSNPASTCRRRCLDIVGAEGQHLAVGFVGGELLLPGQLIGNQQQQVAHPQGQQPIKQAGFGLDQNAQIDQYFLGEHVIPHVIAAELAESSR